MNKPDPEKVQETVARLNAEEKMISVPQGLLGAAVSAIDKKREGVMTIALLRHYAFNGDPAQASEYGDAYQGAREDLAIWKRRALEAEEKLLRLEPLPEPVLVADLSDVGIEASMQALMSSQPSEIRSVPRFVWVRAGDGNHASDCTLDGDVAREWEASGLMVFRLPVQNPLLADEVRQNRDLVMMVKVLCHALKMYCPESKKAVAYMDYLKREGLIPTTDILRDGAKDAE